MNSILVRPPNSNRSPRIRNLHTNGPSMNSYLKQNEGIYANPSCSSNILISMALNVMMFLCRAFTDHV